MYSMYGLQHVKASQSPMRAFGLKFPGSGWSCAHGISYIVIYIHSYTLCYPTNSSPNKKHINPRDLVSSYMQLLDLLMNCFFPALHMTPVRRGYSAVPPCDQINGVPKIESGYSIYWHILALLSQFQDASPKLIHHF